MQVRTQVGKASQGKNGKWDISFDTFFGCAGAESLASTATCPAIWDTEDEAYDAGKRALEVLEATGMYPNMCERW